ncbi:MAG: hypothetical protein R2749_05990 [Acidimicrobiales bacterium]
MQRFDVRTPSIHTPTNSLSGGNKQKVIVARAAELRRYRWWLPVPPGGWTWAPSSSSTTSSWPSEIGGRRAVVSAELDEVLGLSDRVAVMSEGRIVAMLPIEEADRNRIGMLMAGSA